MNGSGRPVRKLCADVRPHTEIDKPQADDRWSQRAREVADDLLGLLDEDLRGEGAGWKTVVFHLDGSSVFLDSAKAVAWIKDSVDEGFPAVAYYIEERGPDLVVVNLAAAEDPDSQYHP